MVAKIVSQPASNSGENLGSTGPKIYSLTALNDGENDGENWALSGLTQTVAKIESQPAQTMAKIEFQLAPKCVPSNGL